jgi:hypothetical protein
MYGTMKVSQIVATKKMLAAEAAAGPPDGAAGDVRHVSIVINDRRSII